MSEQHQEPQLLPAGIAYPGMTPLSEAQHDAVMQIEIDEPEAGQERAVRVTRGQKVAAGLLITAATLGGGKVVYDGVVQDLKNENGPSVDIEDLPSADELSQEEVNRIAAEAYRDRGMEAEQVQVGQEQLPDLTEAKS